MAKTEINIVVEKFDKDHYGIDAYIYHGKKEIIYENDFHGNMYNMLKEYNKIKSKLKKEFSPSYIYSYAVGFDPGKGLS